MHLTYKYRLLPTRKQHKALVAILDSQRALYNAALEERIGCYAKMGKGRTLYDQQCALTEWRRRCSGCGELVPKALAVRTHSCLSCGFVIDRDWNAARNILHAAVVGGGLENVARWGERRAGNLTEISR
jgi:transposase